MNTFYNNVDFTHQTQRMRIKTDFQKDNKKERNHLEYIKENKIKNITFNYQNKNHNKTSTVIPNQFKKRVHVHYSERPIINNLTEQLTLNKFGHISQIRRQRNHSLSSIQLLNSNLSHKIDQTK